MSQIPNPALLPKTASLPGFSPESRIWVYVSSRPLTEAEAESAQKQLNAFCQQWTAHNQSLMANAEVFNQQFVVLMVDESRAGASGCSIDKSVHFLETLGANLQVDFFERMRFAWVDEQGAFQFGNKAELAAAVNAQHINEHTLMANPLVQTKQEFNEKWLLPFHQSWHRRIAAAHR